MHRVLYLPIFEPGRYHDIALANKHGLRSAFEAAGACYELDYLTIPPEKLYQHLRGIIDDFQPTLLFTQFQGPHINPADLRAIREECGIPIVNWNGDYWPDSLISPDMLWLLRHVDLQLVVNGSALDTYAREGIRAAFWAFGFETPNRPLPDVAQHDVVYLGNCYHEWRMELYWILRSLLCTVGIYGNGWPECQGECTYDFAYGAALYQNARIAISDNRYRDAAGYLSNRPFQAMAAGCFVLQQHVPRLEEFTGLKAGVHYVEFGDIAEIPDLTAEWLARDAERAKIASQGQAFVHTAHSFEARVKQLFEELLPEVSHG